MAYTGFISDPSYCRKDSDVEISGNWSFQGETLQVDSKTTFTQPIIGTAMSAYWGDVAEIYLCDPHEVLIPGTLVKFGGKYEITKTNKNDKKCFGVISTKPGVVLNKREPNGEKVALVGRVPCRVVGEIKKFDKLTTSKVPGVAKKKTFLDTLLLKPTIGISLHTDTTKGEKSVEIFVRVDK